VLKRRATDEQGSIVLSLMIVVVSVIALTALSNSLIAGLNQARTEQSRSSALQLANAGLDLAVYRIDSGEEVGSFGEEHTESTGTATITATLTGDGTWEVRSVGHDSAGKERLVIATVSTPKLFPDALFSAGGFSVTGNQADLYWYDSATSPNATSVTDADLTPIPGTLGSNGDINGSGIDELWSGFNLYGRSTPQEALDGCVGCTPSKVHAITDRLERTPPSFPSGVTPVCPTSDGVIPGGTIAAGDYRCSSLTLEGTINVTGRVRIWVDGPFEAADGAVVNRYGRPQNLQILQATQADGSPYDGDQYSVCGADLWALLFTPGLVVKCNGSHQPTIHGAYIIDSYAGTGNDLEYYYDTSAAAVGRDGTFGVTNWRECPVGPTAC
jgi:hypothetical protein